MTLPSHTVRSLADLRANPDKVLAHLRRSKKPLLLTKNGVPDVMLLDLRKANGKINARRLEELIEEAEADVAAGRFEELSRFMKRFRHAHNL